MSSSRSSGVNTFLTIYRQADTLSEELKRLKQGAARVGGDKYRPTFTFVVCAKRHHMRFFAANPGDQDRTGNLPPGTVVDKSVTHPYAFDFYRKPRHYRDSAIAESF